MAPFCTQTEIDKITQQDIEVEIFENSKFCAVANNIACNDKIAIVNEQLAKVDIKRIEEALQVEAIPMKINQYYTVGMMISLTNRGFLVHNRVEEEQMQQIEQKTGLKGINGTVNSGTPIVGLGIVANSKGALVGEATTGFETARIEQGLELIE
jgi:translation initiation factor 6